MNDSASHAASAATPMDPAVNQLYREILDAWNARDAPGMAALFMPDGNCVGFDGSQIDGAAAIEAAMAQVFANHQTARYVGIVREVRPLGEDVALLRAVAGMVPPGNSDLNPAVNAIQTLVAVQAGERWRIALWQNTPAQFHGRPELAAQLTEELRQVLAAEGI